MNVVLDDAEELSIKKKTRKALGRILLKGDNITLMMNTYGPPARAWLWEPKGDPRSKGGPRSSEEPKASWPRPLCFAPLVVLTTRALPCFAAGAHRSAARAALEGAHLVV